MKRLFVTAAFGLLSTGGPLVLIQACGGDSSTNDGGMDGTVGQDVQQGMDGNMGMDTNGMDSNMGMDGTMGTDGSGTGPNPGKVNCGTMVECDAGGSGCCIRQIDGGPNFSCQVQGQCGGNGVRWQCDESADCPQNNPICCIDTMNTPFLDKACQGNCGGGTVRACKQNGDCPDAGACGTYTCPNSIVIQSCTKPSNCN